MLYKLRNNTTKTLTPLTMIILADQNCRQIPKRSNVKRLKQLPLVSSTITIHCKRHILVLRVLLSKSQSTTEGDLSSDDAMTTVKSGLLEVEVHGSALAVGAAGAAAHELGEDLNKGTAAAEVRAVVAVGGDDAVFLCDGGVHADGDGLLAVVEVAEAADELGLVEAVGGDLHAAHDGHVAEEGEELGGGGGDGARGRVAVVGGEGDGGLHGDGVIGGG